MQSNKKTPQRLGGQERQKRKNRKEKVRQRFLEKMPPSKVCVEIGVWRGDFSKVLFETLEPKKLILIDPWEEEHRPDFNEALAGRTRHMKMEKIFDSVCSMFREEINTGQVEIIRQRSKEAIAQLSDNSIDFAYIDGDHSYQGVQADLRDILPKIRPGGLIALDDYHRKGWWGIGVIKAVNEFIGANASDVRIMALEGAQVAVQKLPPLIAEAK